METNVEEVKVQTFESIKALVDNVAFKDFTFRVGTSDGSIFLQVQFYDTCTQTGERLLQSCRKWFLSKHSTDSEIIRTAFKAVMAAFEHEVQENFTYKGYRLFNPHHDLDFLVDFAKKRKVSIRS